MSRKSKKLVFISIAIVLVGMYFVNISLKDDAMEIEKILESIGVVSGDIIHIEQLDKKNAIAFYSSEFDESLFGHALVKKNMLGWKLMESSAFDYRDYSPDMKLGWSWQNLEQEKDIDYTGLVSGRIFDHDITKVKVITEDGNEYAAEIINDRGKSFWYLLSKNRNIDTAVTVGISELNEIIFEYPERSLDK